MQRPPGLATRSPTNLATSNSHGADETQSEASAAIAGAPSAVPRAPSVVRTRDAARREIARAAHPSRANTAGAARALANAQDGSGSNMVVTYLAKTAAFDAFNLTRQIQKGSIPIFPETLSRTSAPLALIRMLHVPGVYSGGSGDGFEWTQRKSEVEVRVPLPTADAVTCDIHPRSFSLQCGTLHVGGTLPAPINLDGSIWSIDETSDKESSELKPSAAADAEGDAEGDAGGDAPSRRRRTAVITLRKSAPALWDRLFDADAPMDSAPRLLDGSAHAASEPPTRAQLLTNAKKRVSAELETPSRAKPYTVEGRSDEVATYPFCKLCHTPFGLFMDDPSLPTCHTPFGLFIDDPSLPICHTQFVLCIDDPILPICHTQFVLFIDDPILL